MLPKHKKRRKNLQISGTPCVTKTPKPQFDQETLARRKEHNETETLLARLPIEVRRMIWSLLLGDRVLHLTYDRWMNVDEDGKRREKPGSKGFKLIICTQQTSLQQSYDRWTQKTDEATYTSDTALSEHGHHYCGHFRFVVWAVEDRPLIRSMRAIHFHDYLPPTAEFVSALKLLSTCRFIYTEVQEVLYGTSVFSFNHGDHLRSFLQICTPQQRLLLRRLHICIDVSNDSFNAVYWQVRIPKCDIDRLKSLTELHINLRVAGIPAHISGSSSEMKAVEKAFDCFSGAQLRRVTIIIDQVALPKHEGTNCLTIRQRREWARRIQQSLLDPDKSSGKDVTNVSWVFP